MQQLRDLQNEIEAAATRTGTRTVTSANRGEPIDLTQEPSGVDPLARSSAAQLLIGRVHAQVGELVKRCGGADGGTTSPCSNAPPTQ